MVDYRSRIVDGELHELLRSLPALSLEGPKGVGKTFTAERFGGTVHRLDSPALREVLGAQPQVLTTGQAPVVVDEWQRYPDSWDVVRRAVDDDPSPGRFILTGSATPTKRPTHTGAARIVPVRMRPMTLPERGLSTPTVSLGGLLSGERRDLGGHSEVILEDYVNEILTGGFPGMRISDPRARRAALRGYLDRIVDSDLPELGVEVRRPATLVRWLRAYAAATATTTAYDKIRDAATAGEVDKPAKTTAILYREALERIWILDPQPSWAPTDNHLSRLTGAPRHHLVDPALAAQLVGIDAAGLLEGKGPDVIPRRGSWLGALFESLAVLNIRVFAQLSEATISHLRTKEGRQEVDIIVERTDHQVMGIEVKLSSTVGSDDVRHLVWLRDKIGGRFLDGAVVYTGTYAYRRQDGIAVIPLALLGP